MKRTFHIISGFDSCSNLKRLQASSTRSIDLSGCFRSDKYLSDNVAAAISDSSLYVSHYIVNHGVSKMK